MADKAKTLKQVVRKLEDLYDECVIKNCIQNQALKTTLFYKAYNEAKGEIADKLAVILVDIKTKHPDL